MQKVRITSRDRLLNIANMTHVYELFLKHKPVYRDFLKCFSKLLQEDANWTSLATLSKVTGIPTRRLSKLIFRLHEDMFSNCDDSEKTLITFSNIDYAFLVNNGFDPVFMMAVKNMPFVPRVGDKVGLDYFVPFITNTLFDVTKVRHWYSGNTQRVVIHLDVVYEF